MPENNQQDKNGQDQEPALHIFGRLNKSGRLRETASKTVPVTIPSSIPSTTWVPPITHSPIVQETAPETASMAAQQTEETVTMIQAVNNPGQKSDPVPFLN